MMYRRLIIPVSKTRWGWIAEVKREGLPVLLLSRVGERFSTEICLSILLKQNEDM